MTLKTTEKNHDMKTTEKNHCILFRAGNAWTNDGENMPARIFRTRREAEHYARRMGYTPVRDFDCDRDGPDVEFTADQFDREEVEA